MMILRIGCCGRRVQKLQRDLNQLREDGAFRAVDELEVDGVFGDLTAGAVVRFQKAQRLQVDGIVGDETFGAMAELLLPKPAPDAPPPPAPAQVAPLTQKLLEVAQNEVGTREVGGNNCGFRIREYQRATEETPGAWPWCAAFVCWCVREWLAAPGVPPTLGWDGAGETERPKTAQAFAFIDWARNTGQSVLPPTVRPQPGMLVIYSFSHIGIVKKAIDDQTFLAIEGNTNGAGARDSVTGDGVWEKRRANRLVRAFIDWRFLQAPGPDQPALGAPAPVPAGVLPAARGIGDIPKECLEFIVDQEGMDQPYLFPGGDSGVSLGHGYDLGAESEAELRDNWARWLSAEQLNRLSAASGKSGPAAAALCPGFRDIQIAYSAADDVFFRCTVPKYFAQTAAAFPGLEKFPGEVQGAMLSLVFNRGTSTKGPRRVEMASVKDLIAAGEQDADALRKIAFEFREMKRLWQGKGLHGLVARREAEARMIESAIV